MASKRAERRRACARKVRYGTEPEARAAMHAVNARRPSGWMLTYRCRFCGGYHFGHPPARIRQAIAARRGA